MIEFDEYYNIAADEIATIETYYDSKDTDFPYILMVTLKNGRNVSVKYKDKRTRSIKRRDILAQIAREKSWSYEQIYAKVGWWRMQWRASTSASCVYGGYYEGCCI